MKKRSTNEWIFRKDEVDNSPSVSSGDCTAKLYDQIIRSSSVYLATVGRELKFPQLTIATAMVYFRRYYMVHSLKKIDAFHMAAACLFVAGKVEETPKKIRDLLIVAWAKDPRHKNKGSQNLNHKSNDFLIFQNTLLNYEMSLLCTIKFKFVVEHPYRFVLQFCRTKDNKNLAKTAWEIINCSYSGSSLFLRYDAQSLALAAIGLAAKSLKLEREDHGSKQKTIDQVMKEMNQCLRRDQERKQKQAKAAAERSRHKQEQQYTRKKKQENSDGSDAAAVVEKPAAKVEESKPPPPAKTTTSPKPPAPNKRGRPPAPKHHKSSSGHHHRRDHRDHHRDHRDDRDYRERRDSRDHRDRDHRDRRESREHGTKRHREEEERRGPVKIEKMAKRNDGANNNHGAIRPKVKSKIVMQ